MNVLIACEESQRVCIEFRKLGVEAYSCDILPCSGGHPEWHINSDVLSILNGKNSNMLAFTTEDGNVHDLPDKWDAIIAFPPCTHLAVSGAAWFEGKRKDGRQRQGLEFFCKFLTANCAYVAIENPVGIISGDYVRYYFPDIAKKYGLPLKPTQIIQPYEFGEKVSKKTCLWLRGLPTLKPTSEKPDDLERVTFASGKTMDKWYASLFNLPPAERAKARSKTFPGVAKAMATQWVEYLNQERK